MKNNYYLVCSSCLFLIAIIYFLCNFNIVNNYEILLVLLLSSNLICSIIFWSKNKPNSIEHKIDSFLAKISSVLIICYIYFIKDDYPKYNKIIAMLIVIISLLLFYLSSKISKKEWCSRKHIITHSIFHLSVTAGYLFAFI